MLYHGSVMNSKISLISAFYEAVDRKDVEAAMSIFSRDALYVRGTRTIVGIDAIGDFYVNGRCKTILDGTHVFDSIEELDNVVTVIGTFVGTYADNSTGFVQFIDRFEFDGDTVHRRRTDFPGREI